MSKNFGKIVLVSTILAGAAAGSYAYLKKEGLIKGDATIAKDIASKVKSDADELLGKERSYVDLSLDAEAEAEDIEDTLDEEITEDSFEPGIVADKIEAADVNTIGSKTSEEFFNDEEEN